MQLDEHEGDAAAVEQRAVGAAHFLLHCPQLSGRVRSVSQPSSARLEQCANPDAQAPAGTEHTPAWQVMPVAPALTLGRAEQSWPQVPQFLASLLRLTHSEPQASGAELPQLEPQREAPAVTVHNGFAPEQAVVQPPQVRASARFASQPSSGRGEQ